MIRSIQVHEVLKALCVRHCEPLAEIQDYHTGNNVRLTMSAALGAYYAHHGAASIFSHTYCSSPQWTGRATLARNDIAIF